MVKVYFESRTSAELVATFATEELYMVCLPKLKGQAEQENKTLTESIKS